MFLSSDIFSNFFKDLKFLPNRFFTCMVRVTLRYFVFFVAIVKGVASPISSSAHLLFVYRRAADFSFSFLS